MPGKAVAEAVQGGRISFFSNKQKKEDVRAGNVEREQGNEAEERGYDDNAGRARVGYGESKWIRQLRKNKSGNSGHKK